MGDEDLEELARLAVSGRQIAVAVGLAIVACAMGFVLIVPLGVSPRFGAGALIALIAGSLAIAYRVRTPPGAFPAIRFLRDRPGDVAYIISVSRGSIRIVLAGRDGKMLTQPLAIKGSTRLRGGKEDSQRSARAVELAAARCPHARTASVTDLVGLSSLDRLVGKAIRELPPVA